MSTSSHRPEIQALRAIAVALVVVFHVWPAVLRGGFVGVDVFFVISGFLITTQLLREVDRSGRVSLAGFWARRARRLLPAALVTLLATAVATIVFVPRLYWEQFLTEIGASTAYVQNWQLAHDAVDYMARGERASPVQHFWSLSVEEQFYLVWPLLILAAALLVGRGRGKRVAIFTALGAVTVASLAYSLIETARTPDAAYFVTPTRAWEFGLGGLLAFLGVASRLPEGARAVLSWGGIAAILAAAIGFDAATPFPGSAALLPVLGAVAVIAAGAPTPRWSPTPLLERRPVQFLGDISYSVYLWHWPLIVLLPFMLAVEGTALRIAAIAITIPLAWMTKIAVEDPVRRAPALTAARPRRTLGLAAPATAAVLAVVAVASLQQQDAVQSAQQASQEFLAENHRCFGAAANDPRRPCENPELRRKVVPSPIAREEDENVPCDDIERDGTISVCEFGVPQDRAKRTVAIVGDSHAAHWRPAFEVVARRRGWRAMTITRTSCPFSKATKDLRGRARSRCIQWNRELPRWFAEHSEVDTLFVAGIAGGKLDVSSGESSFQAQVDGYREAWTSLPASVRHIVVLRDTPRFRQSTFECIDDAIASEKRAGLACALPKQSAMTRDPATVAAQALPAGRRPEIVDLTRYLCSSRLCFPVIGGALAYKDADHFTRIFSTTLGRPLLRATDRLAGSWRGDGAADTTAAADGGGDQPAAVAVAGAAGVQSVR